jgi:hypothetical protein
MVAAEIAIHVGEEPEDDVEAKAIPFSIGIVSSTSHHGSSSLQAGPGKD